MERSDFSPNTGAYSAIESFLQISGSSLSNDDSAIITMDDAQFELPPYDVTMDKFYQQLENSLENRTWAPQYSAFSAYIHAHSTNVADTFVSSETLHKRCFRFLRKMDEDRKLEIQRLRQTPPVNDKEVNEKKKKNKAKTAFHHMIAERNRRVKLNEHFKNLHSLLPRKCKKDKHSILASTTSYLRELKVRVCELEQQSESVDEPTARIVSNSEGGSSGFESQEHSFNLDSSLLYRGDDVIFERCRNILCHVQIIINVHRNMVSCSATLLVKIIALLSAEQLEILSLSHAKGFGFQASFVVIPKGDDWDISHWQSFGSLVTRILNSAIQRVDDITVET